MNTTYVILNNFLNPFPELQFPYLQNQKYIAPTLQS